MMYSKNIHVMIGKRLNEPFGKRRNASFNNTRAAGLVWGAGDHRAIMVLIHHRSTPLLNASPPLDCTATALAICVFSPETGATNTEHASKRIEHSRLNYSLL